MRAPAVRIRRRCDTSANFDYNRPHLNTITGGTATPYRRHSPAARSRLGKADGPGRRVPDSPLMRKPGFCESSSVH